MTNPALPEIYGHLDADIAPLVHALRSAGFPTSCSGGSDRKDSWLNVPFVNIAADGKGPLAVGIMRVMAARWLRERGITANVCEVWTTLQDEPEFPFVRVEIFSDLSEARF